MSSLGGTYERDGRNACVEDLKPLAMAMERISNEGGGEEATGPVALGYRAFEIIPHEHSALQPLITPLGSVITWNGRLDNRDDLAAQLGLRSRNVPDVQIVASALERWGQETYRRLVGDWAAAVWDRRTAIITLARDYAGAYPLYYHLDTRRLTWCSELEGLVAAIKIEGKQARLNDLWFAGYFARGPEPGLTPYIDIHSVPPGCYVEIDRTRCVTRRHFGFCPAGEIRYRTDSE